MGLFKRAKAEQDKAVAEHGGLGGAMSARDDMVARGQEMMRERERLMASGLPGSATVVEARDTGGRSFGNATIEIDLAVTLDSGEQFRTTLSDFMIAGTDMGPYATGTAYTVRVDPDDHSKLAFV